MICKLGNINLADRKKLQGAAQNERLLKAEENGYKEIILAKSGLVSRVEGMSTFL